MADFILADLADFGRSWLVLDDLADLEYNFRITVESIVYVLMGDLGELAGSWEC